jgi:hypothetical protein
VVQSGFTAEEAENGNWSRTEMQMMFPGYLPHHHPVKLEVGEKAPLEVEKEEERAEEAIIIGLVTQMSHRFPHSLLPMTHMIVQVHQTAETNPEGVA